MGVACDRSVRRWWMAHVAVYFGGEEFCVTSKKAAAASIAVVVSLGLVGAVAAQSAAGGVGLTHSESVHAGVVHADCAHPTPLQLATLRGNVAEIRKLLLEGADVAATDALGETALHSAARRFRVEAAAALIEAGAPLEARNGDGMTPLTLLASMGPSEVPEVDDAKARLAALLIDAGALVNAPDTAGATAFGYAIAREHPGLTALLRDQGGVQGSFDPAERHGEVERAPSGYPTNAQIGTTLLTMQNTYPAIAERVSLGTSVQGRDLWAIHISDNVGVDEDEPEVSYISTMHGDEVVGLEMTLMLADWLTSNYGSVQRATDMVDELDIWLVPTMNPDGYELIQRYNANGVDLNRNFPDWYDDPVNTPAGRAKEVGLIMTWRSARSFTLSANLHGGALLANYPFDNNPAGASVYSACPDDDLFIDISLEYSEDNAPMYASPTFPQGITNGADWYAVSGGMQDWNYFWLGCNEITIELGNTKTPSHSTIPTYWSQNQESMISYLERAWDGVRGIVTDSTNGNPVFATITVTGRDHAVFTDPDVGDYHRMLLDGTYEVTFEADGYETLVAPSVVVSNAAKAATRLDVQMDPTGSVSAAEVVFPNGGEALPSGLEQILQWSGSATASYQVQATTNYNDTTLVLDGFESGAIGPEYTSGGSASWGVTTSPVYTGTYAAASGGIGNNQITWMERTVNGPGSVDFWYMVSSEAGYDYFTFLIDGQPIASGSGTVAWTEVFETLSTGPHTLRWEYAKDASAVGGSDKAWIDAIKLNIDNTMWSDVVADTGVGVTSYPWTPSTETSAGKIRVRKLLAGGILGPWDESDAVFAVVPPAACVGDINNDLSTDVFDFAILAGNFGQSVPIGTGGDLDDDGDVDVFDFGIFAGDFGCMP